MAQIDGAGQQDTDDQNAEALQAALAQRQVTLRASRKAAVTSLLMRTPIRSQTNRKFYAPVSLLPENVVYREAGYRWVVSDWPAAQNAASTSQV